VKLEKASVQYQVELVWNRSFDWVRFGPQYDSLDRAIAFAKVTENMGDGAEVKETRIVDDNGAIVWAYGKILAKAKEVKI